MPVKYFITCSLISFFVLCSLSFAEEIYLRDVPEGHYAYDAVYDLIKRGITGGYPDGTFRGKNPVSRYEIASFISKLAKSFNVRRGADEKLIEELKSEVSLLQYRADKEEKETQVSGDLQARWRGWRGRGARADYRLRAQVNKNFNNLASLKINLDTMDGGFNNGQRDLVRELLDFEGKVKLGAGVLKVTSGPGDVNHADDGFFPAENNMKYRRPRRAASFSITSDRTSFSLEELVRSTDASGLVGVEEYSLKITQNYSPFRITLNPRLFSDTGGGRDNRLDLIGEFSPAKSFRSTVLLGIAKSSEYPHGLYLRGEITIADWLKILAQKVGTQYREKFSYNLFDLFDRNVADGSSNYGLELAMDFTRDWFARFKGDYTNPGEIVTTEIHLGRNVTATSDIELIYQTYRAQDFSQVLGLTAAFRF